MRYFITGILLVFTLSTLAQKVLILENVGRGKYFIFKEGDIIHLRTIIGKFDIQDDIFRISDSSIVVGGGYLITFNNIDYIEKTYRNRKRNGMLVMIAGGVLTVITSINNISHDKQAVDPLYLSIGMGLAAAGGVWYSMGTRKYHIGNKWRLKLLDGFPY